MSSNVRPKQNILFPNSWALNSFLLRLKRFTEWEYLASSNDVEVKIKPKGGADYILIGLNKSGAGYLVNINAEKLGDKTDLIWKQLYDFARLYRC